jgi:hypothetical protein
MFKSINACDAKSPPCNSLTIWTKESRIYFSVYQSIVIFAFINSRSLNTCCVGTWLCVVTVVNTLIGTLST